MSLCTYKTSDYYYNYDVQNSTPESVMFSLDDVHLSGFHFDIMQIEIPKSVDSDSYAFIFSVVTLVTWE